MNPCQNMADCSRQITKNIKHALRKTALSITKESVSDVLNN